MNEEPSIHKVTDPRIAELFRRESHSIADLWRWQTVLIAPITAWAWTALCFVGGAASAYLWSWVQAGCP